MLDAVARCRLEVHPLHSSFTADDVAALEKIVGSHPHTLRSPGGSDGSHARR